MMGTQQSFFFLNFYSFFFSQLFFVSVPPLAAVFYFTKREF